MELGTALGLTLLFLVVAALYASVGHAGASGYLAAMALLGMAPATMRSTALVLNILVATIATIKFSRAGYFSWPVFWPFALTSIPFAFIGGGLALPNPFYKTIIGIILLYAACRLFQATKVPAPATSRSIPLGRALVSGLGIGLLSGLTGTGGGIFLSPLLLLMGWAEPRQASGVSATFIQVNSVAGLLGQVSSMQALPATLPLWAAAAAVGGWIGAEYGSRRLNNMGMRRFLAMVLVIAGLKLIFA